MARRGSQVIPPAHGEAFRKAITRVEALSRLV
jgi:hypothetical protein